MAFETRDRLIGISLALFCFILYVRTLCPTTDFIDAGELSTVAYTLGIAHPTGYPMFTLVGWLFSHLPLGLTVVYKMNLMAATLCAIGIYIFYRFLLFLGRELVPSSLSLSSWISVIPALTGGLILGLSETYWAQAVAVEVYSLHVVFLSMQLLFFTKAVHGELDGKAGMNRAWWLFAFTLGLAFTNHMTTILLAPGFLFLYFYSFRFGADSWRRIFRMVMPFLLGLSLYLYLPVRAMQGPLMIWGNPIDLDRFLWHFTGKQYRVWIFSSSDSAMKQFQYFVSTLGPNFAYAPLVLSILGLIRLGRRQKVFFFFSLLLFFGCIFYAINYDIHDIDSYFLLAYFTVAIWGAVGTAVLLEWIAGAQMKLLAGIALPVITAGLLLTNYSTADESSLTLVESYTRDMFNSVENDAIIISYQWDYFVSAANYFQIVEQIRPDVIVIDKELLRRSWYYRQMQIRYPQLYDGSKTEIEAFLKELYKFEHDLPYDPGMIERRYAEVIHSFIDRNYDHRPVYVTSEVEDSYLGGYRKVPAGLAIRLYKDGSYHINGIPRFTYNIPPQKDRLIDGILTQYARAYVNNSYYMHLGGNDKIALELVGKALEIDPLMPEAMELSALLQKGR